MKIHGKNLHINMEVSMVISITPDYILSNDYNNPSLCK